MLLQVLRMLTAGSLKPGKGSLHIMVFWQDDTKLRGYGWKEGVFWCCTVVQNMIDILQWLTAGTDRIKRRAVWAEAFCGLTSTLLWHAVKLKQDRQNDRCTNWALSQWLGQMPTEEYNWMHLFWEDCVLTSNYSNHIITVLTWAVI